MNERDTCTFTLHPHVCTSPVLIATCIYATFFFHWDGISTKKEIALSTVEMTCEEQVSNSTMHSCSLLYAAHKCPRLSQHNPNHSSQGYIKTTVWL